ncbi:MAG: hypothetical protein Q8941_00855 [Bacteroidota bacterium]|nr:hypothetical protein [Bacteroidota bacterium]
MARSTNSALKGIRGRVGNLIFKQYSYGTVVTLVPDMDNVKTTPQQRAQRDYFAEAVAYAKEISRNPGKKEAYRKKHKLEKGKSVFNAAIQEFKRKNKKRYTEILVEVLEEAHNGKKRPLKKRR